jgi:hypothetical protein
LKNCSISKELYIRQPGELRWKRSSNPQGDEGRGEACGWWWLRDCNRFDLKKSKQRNNKTKGE